MNRTVARAAALLASALVALPATCAATAVAVDKGDGPLVVITTVNQRADGDIFNVGHDNIVGSGNGNGAPSTGVGAPGAGSAVVRITTGVRLPFDGVRLASHEGSGEYPPAIYPNYLVNVAIDGPSEAVYQSAGTAGQVRVTATLDTDGKVRPNCSAEGNLDCHVDYDAQGQYLVIDGR
ncbi:hypothetical protein ACWD4F_21560 [Streptomyces aureus]|uniref:hypothetical protein n=1 Tax=Streptomyces aureus TaxID=193461 RepID=UPI000AFB14D2|nr:hypothetical protein [Streptomyces aureus]